jgi:hypothetical protein
MKMSIHLHFSIYSLSRLGIHSLFPRLRSIIFRMCQNHTSLLYFRRQKNWLPQFNKQRDASESVLCSSDMKFHTVTITLYRLMIHMILIIPAQKKQILKILNKCRKKSFLFYKSMFNIALNTFREIFRNKFFGLIIFLGIMFLGISLVLDNLAMGESRRVLFDFGLSFIEITGVAIILFLGGGMLAREIDGRTIYLMISKPISRSTIIFGKFF